MSRQSLLDIYFKSKSNVPSSPNPFKTSTCENIMIKKRNTLSPINVSTPKKAPKMSNNGSGSNHIDAMEDFIVLSDDESVNLSQSSNKNEDVSDTSQKTTTYSWSQSTPQKIPQTPSSTSRNSKDKFFSPTKNRTVLKKTPVKRNLSEAFCNSQIGDFSEDEDFTNACEGMDDKTIFLMTIINKYVRDDYLNQLLDDSSHELLCRCMHVLKPGMRLVCRLYWRQKGWYRREQVAQISSEKKKEGKQNIHMVMDDPSIQLMLNSLVENGLIVPVSLCSLTLEDYTKILKIGEIKQICKDLKLKMQSKQSSIESLKNFSRQSSITKYFTGSTYNNSKRVLEIMEAKAGPCFKLSEAARSAFYKLYVLIYLGMNYVVIRQKKLELMLINEKINREVYPIDKQMNVDNASVVFKTKDEFARYMNAHCIYEDFLAETDWTEKCKTVLKVYNLYKEVDADEMMRYKSLPIWLRKFTPSNIYVKILEAGIQDLKKDKTGKDYELALEILTTLISQIAFRQHKKAEWYAEKALILHKLLGRHNEAAEVLVEGFNSNLSKEVKDIMRPRANKIVNQQNIILNNDLKEALILYASKESMLEKKLTADHITKKPMENTQRGKIKFEIRDHDGRRYLDAEEYCIEHYKYTGHFTHGEHWEGRIVTTIFFLLFWDIIYTKPRGVNGIFLSHYQIYPLDMFCESFYINRKTLIDDWLMTIEQSSIEKLLDAMQCKWEERAECELSGITRSIGWDNIQMVVSCLGAKATSAICRRLATNYGYTYSGFPDLTLWNINTKKIKFVEVKTDSDKPSIKQLQWMHYLQQHDIDTGFSYLGVNTSRAKSRPVAF